MLAATARYPAVAGGYDDLWHGGLGVFEGPFGAGARPAAGGAGDQDDLFRDRVDEPEPVRARLLVLRDTDPRVDRRSAQVEDLLERRHLPVIGWDTDDAPPLLRLAQLVGVLDFAASYLAMLYAGWTRAGSPAANRPGPRRDGRAPDGPDEQPPEAPGAVVAALAANLGIAAAKFVGFFITGSASMLAESVHSVADSANQLLLLLGGRTASREATEEHPFGYGRDRYFYAFVVALVIFSPRLACSRSTKGVHKLEHPHEARLAAGARW